MRRDVQVTAADIARLAGVGRAAVSNWRRRHDDFPEPVGGTATSPAFSLGEIRTWLLSHGDGRKLPPDEWLWQDLRAVADDDELADLIADLGAFLAYTHRRGGDWTDLAAGDDATVAAKLPGRVREVIGAFPASLAADAVPLIRSIAALAAERGAPDAFEFLCERYFEVHSRRVYLTPPEIVALSLDLAEIDARTDARTVYDTRSDAGSDAGSAAWTVFDPACGAGGFLVGALDRLPGARVTGQDADRTTARLTAVRLALCTENADIRTGDSLRADAFPGDSADVVVSNPPFNDRGWGYEELTADPRWEYGLPPRMESELAWVQHALAHLKADGIAVLLMPPAVGNRRSGRRIRAQLLRRGALRAVVALPAGSVPNVAVALTLWILRRPAEARTPSHVLMVDTSAHPDDYAEVATAAWREFTEGRELDEPGVSRSVPLVDLLDDEVDLTPARYLSTASEDLSPERVTGARNRVVDLLRVLAELVPATTTEPRDLTLVPLSELLRRGMLTVHQQAPTRPGETSEVPDDSTVLTAEDVVAGRPASGKTPERAVQREILTRPGDVAVPQVVRVPVARVLTQGGAVLGTQLHLLRPDPAMLDPDFLAGFLCSSSNLRHYSSMSTNIRVDVRRAEVPLLPIEEQRAYGEAFRRLAAFESALRQAAELGENLIQLTADGLTHGSVRPYNDNDVKGNP
ncbi:type I restriction-modification system DNA methylase subunit [Streptosporangium album]|uniref:Type I restriction-modification system DNA methylase subunit n=1 Tax=Streptosporangium album TaxID=47479 RepID=A0A7W7S2G7_9ACTN|nr:N-6 DNA methylase [Streptosporangium album]MBB4942497.1 type I restriction-modification system DNA methylase subunit [Streptosporangium album]